MSSLPTPAPTQQALVPAGTMDVDNGLKRHEKFYETTENLKDPVILRVRPGM